ncbi:hypothetical protein C8Q79DRAFT_174944 [Trametes meyenii]|nr:hypothetical protein C8Q79DRAFT_174944 [Trametes meyenii]
MSIIQDGPHTPNVRSVGPSSISLQQGFVDVLPDDALIEILKNVHALVFADPETALWEWMPILQVCWRWRNIVQAISWFWRVIPPWHGTETLLFFLPRAAGASLEVHLDITYYSNQHLALLLPALPRLRLLSFKRIYVANGFEAPWAIPVISTLCHEMPSLEDLYLEIPLNTPNSWQTPELQLQLFPRLRHLSLSGAVVPSLPANLTILNIYDCPWAIPFIQFLDVLARCPDLEQLNLSSTLGHWYLDLPAGLGQLPCRPIITLRRLQVLEMLNVPPSSMLAILAHIEVPTIKHLTLLCATPRRHHPLPPMLPPTELVSTLPLQSAITRVFPHLSGPVALVVSRSQICVNWTTANEHAQLFGRPRAAGVGPSAILSSLLLDAVGFLPSPQPDSVDLTISEGDFETISADTWANVFASLGSLRTLTLKGQGPLVAAWTGLKRATQRLPAGELCCPHLQAIRLAQKAPPLARRERMYRKDCAVLLEMLEVRAEWGAKLGELVWAETSLERVAVSEFGEQAAIRLAPFVLEARIGVLDG